MDFIKEEMIPSCCVNCLSKDNERNIYKLKSENLKMIIKVDALTLCFMCKKLVQNAECIIEKIINNQILVNLHDFSEKAIDIMVQPCLNVVILDPIEVSGMDEQMEEPILVYKHGVYKDSIVKDEMKFEDDLDNEIDFIDIQIDIKNEHPDINAESETDINELNIVKKTVKKQKEIKRGRKGKELTIKTLYINNEQIMQERYIKANEITYMNSTYKCADCVKGFAYKGTYQKHMELHSKDKGDYVCNICKQRMETNDKLFRHKKLHQIRYECLICGIIQKASMRDHYNTHHSKVAVHYKCKTCPKTFTDRFYLRKHASYCKKDMRVTCAHCMKTYSNKKGLKTHIQLRHPTVLPPTEIKKTIDCKECGKACQNPSQLKIHSLKHSSEKRFYCVECDKSYKCEYTLKQHLKLASRHVNPSELPLACTHCDKRFGVKRNLVRHMNRIHLNIRPYKCDLCEKAFDNSWGLTKHKKISHEGYKRPYIFPCTMCDRMFDQKSILKSHIRTHTGERPYQCTRCPANFTQSSALGTHTKLVHLKQTRDGKPKNLK